MARIPTGLPRPRVENHELQVWIDSVTDQISALGGNISRDIAAVENRLAQTLTNIGGGMVAPSTPGDSIPTLASPPRPEDVTAIGGIGSVVISWSNPFRRYRNHGETHVYRNTTNNFTTASEIGDSSWLSYVDDTVTPGVQYWYWAIFESTSAVRGSVSAAVSVTAASSPADIEEDILDFLRMQPSTAALMSNPEDASVVAGENRQAAAIMTLLAAGAAHFAQNAAETAQNEINSVTIDVDRLTAYVPEPHATELADIAQPGGTLSLGPSGNRSDVILYGGSRDGSLFTLDVAKGVTWGSGTIQVPTRTRGLGSYTQLAIPGFSDGWSFGASQNDPAEFGESTQGLPTATWLFFWGASQTAPGAGNFVENLEMVALNDAFYITNESDTQWARFRVVSVPEMIVSSGFNAFEVTPDGNSWSLSNADVVRLSWAPEVVTAGVHSLTTNAATAADVDAAGEWHVDDTVKITIDPSRLRVATDRQSLLGGVGMVEQNGKIGLVITPDRLFVISGDGSNQVVPFLAERGGVFMNTAVIREASIGALKAEQGFLNNLTAVHGKLQSAQIGDLDVFDISVDGQIVSSNYEQGVDGFRLTKSGESQFPAAHIVGGLSADQITTGQLSAELIDGPGLRISADQITSGTINANRLNVAGIQTWFPIWIGNRDVVQNTGFFIAYDGNIITEFDFLVVVMTNYTSTRYGPSAFINMNLASSTRIPSEGHIYTVAGTSPEDDSFMHIEDVTDIGFTFKGNPGGAGDARLQGIYGIKHVGEFTVGANPDEDFDTLIAAENNNPWGIWSNSAHMYVADSGDDKIYAYDFTTKERAPERDFDTLAAAGNTVPRGIWSDRSHMYVVDSGDDKIYAYDFTTKERAPERDFDTLAAAGNTVPRGIWSDRSHMYVVDNIDTKIYAYDFTTKARVPSRDFNTLVDFFGRGNSVPQGIWSDGTHMYVSDLIDDKIYAYNFTTKARVPNEDYNSLEAAGNTSPRGIWSNGVNMFVADDTNDKIYAYTFPGTGTI